MRALASGQLLLARGWGTGGRRELGQGRECRAQGIGGCGAQGMEQGEGRRWKEGEQGEGYLGTSCSRFTPGPGLGVPGALRDRDLTWLKVLRVLMLLHQSQPPTKLHDPNPRTGSIRASHLASAPAPSSNLQDPGGLCAPTGALGFSMCSSQCPLVLCSRRAWFCSTASWGGGGCVDGIWGTWVSPV